MPVLVVPCPHCSNGSQLETDQLPDQPAFFPCPHCQQRVVVDKKQLLAQHAAELAAAEAGPPTAPVPQAATPLRVVSTAPNDRRFTKVPAGFQFPGGIVLGEDAGLIETIQGRMAQNGSELELVDSVDAAKHMVINEQPELCVYVAGQVTEPPFKTIAPIVGLPVNLRRRLYLMLVTDNLKTLDGTAAFLYQANMVFNKQDIDHFEEALYSGIEFHNRLYDQFFAASELKGAI